MLTQEEIYSRVSKIEDDCDVWAFLISQRGNPNLPVIVLDNDDTFLEFRQMPGCDGGYFYEQLDFYLGWSEGIFKLLKALGLPHESV